MTTKPSAAAMRAAEKLSTRWGVLDGNPRASLIAQYIDAEPQPLLGALASLTEPGLSAEELYRRRQSAREVLAHAREEEVEPSSSGIDTSKLDGYTLDGPTLKQAIRNAPECDETLVLIDAIVILARSVAQPNTCRRCKGAGTLLADRFSSKTDPCDECECTGLSEWPRGLKAIVEEALRRE